MIRVTVNGRLAYTVDLAAAEHDISRDAMRKIIDRAKLPEADRLGNMPLYYATGVKQAMGGRKGRGAPGVARPHRVKTDDA
jgi:hypothetical protein